MSTTKKSYLQTLPVELIHRIFDEIDTETIVFSIRCVCKRFYSIANTYSRYKLDFRYVSKSDLPLMARIIDPKNIISLTLSDEYEKFAKIQTFFSHFSVDQFIRLRSLTLFNVKVEDLNEFQKHIMKYPLIELSIEPHRSNIDDIKSFISSILAHNDLRRFKLTGEYSIVNEIQCPVSCGLQHLTIGIECIWDTVYSILDHLSHLRTLILQLFSSRWSDEAIGTHPDIIHPTNITSLSLNLTVQLTMVDIELFLSHFPKLTHLRLIHDTTAADSLLFDGYRWENFIGMKLPLLNKFEFWFTRESFENVNRTTVKSLIKAFRTPFWLEIKRWHVRCDYEITDYENKFYLYSIPIFRDYFDYSDRQNAILYSKLNTYVKNTRMIVNTQKLSLDLSQMMNGDIEQNSHRKTDYLFQNVVELEVTIGRKWPIDSIQHLSTIVNLSSLQKLQLRFEHECKFAVSLDIEIDNLFKRAQSLRSIDIGCCDSERMTLLALNAISLKLPHHIKHLATDIIYVEDAKMILERAEHLSNVEFRSRDTKLFLSEIRHWLPRMKRDFVCRILRLRHSCPWDHPDEIIPILLWLGKSMNKNSNTSISHKRIKRSHH